MSVLGCRSKLWMIKFNAKKKHNAKLKMSELMFCFVSFIFTYVYRFAGLVVFYFPSGFISIPKLQ